MTTQAQLPFTPACAHQVCECCGQPIDLGYRQLWSDLLDVRAALRRERVKTRNLLRLVGTKAGK